MLRKCGRGKNIRLPMELKTSSGNQKPTSQNGAIHALKKQTKNINQKPKSN